jgi:23S rRNA pseudouridine955/2504/2580 synthase
VVRLPPLILAEHIDPPVPSKEVMALLASRILYEDDYVLIINKPAGMGVHGGNTVRLGIVETLRYMYPQLAQLELAHRLDLDTSGCLILGKKKRILRELHALLRERQIHKIYWCLTKGLWQAADYRVDMPLTKHFREGEKHVVAVNQEGKASLTVFRSLKNFTDASLVEARLYTGRTHQIRVHAAFKHHPIAGDDRYGDADFNKKMRKLGLKRLFLHAKSLTFKLPSLPQEIKVDAPLDSELEACLQALHD